MTSSADCWLGFLVAILGTCTTKLFGEKDHSNDRFGPAISAKRCGSISTLASTNGVNVKSRLVLEAVRKHAFSLVAPQRYRNEPLLDRTVATLHSSKGEA